VEAFRKHFRSTICDFRSTFSKRTLSLQQGVGSRSTQQGCTASPWEIPSRELHMQCFAPSRPVQDHQWDQEIVFLSADEPKETSSDLSSHFAMS
jgi:hypothetical protein